MTWQEAQKSGVSVLAMSLGGPNITKKPPAAARTTIAKIIFGNLGDMRWPPSICPEKVFQCLFQPERLFNQPIDDF
jgi:hypothetical protein